MIAGVKELGVQGRRAIMTEYGYAGKILRVDLSSRKTSVVPTSDYHGFLGGKGIAARIYWDEVSPDVDALDEGNVLIFAVGPLAGLPVLSGSRWEVCGKSPLSTPQHFNYSNLGGTWGAYMKFAGYDAIVVRGTSEKPVYLVVTDEAAEIKDASALWGSGAIETRERLKDELGKSLNVVSIGPAGENMVTMASLLADNDASGSGGLGAVMGAKNLKSIAVSGSKRGVQVADRERFQRMIERFRELRGGREYPELIAGVPLTKKGSRTRNAPCFGCLGCFRRTYEAEDGRTGKFMCGSAMFYMPRAQSYYGGWNDVPFQATKLCDDYGINALTVELIIHWLQRCYAAGVLSAESTDIPISELGSLEFIETLVRKISLREGFGEVLAEGVLRAAESLGPGFREQATDYASKNGDTMAYHGPRLCITNGVFHAMEPRLPMAQLHQTTGVIHYWLDWVRGADGAHMPPDVLHTIARRFWGSEEAADWQTYQGKALAAKMIQDRHSALECLILCDLLWPIMESEHSGDYTGDPTMESQILSAVTGNEVDEQELYRIGEKVFNLQRAILVREGHRGRDFDMLPESWYTKPLKRDMVFPECLAPDKEGKVVSRKGAVVDKEGFESIKDEYYQIRRWDVSTGLQTRAVLEDLQLREVAEDLERRGLTAGSG